MQLKAIEKIGIGLSAIFIGGLIIQSTVGGSRASTTDYHYQGNPNTLVLIEKRTSTPSSIFKPSPQPQPILEEPTPEEPTNPSLPSDSSRNYFPTFINDLYDALDQWDFLQNVLEDLGLDNIFIKPSPSPIALMSVAYAAEAEPNCSKEAFKDILQYRPENYLSNEPTPLPEILGGGDAVMKITRDAVYWESDQPITLDALNDALAEMKNDPKTFFEPLLGTPDPPLERPFSTKVYELHALQKYFLNDLVLVSMLSSLKALEPSLYDCLDTAGRGEKPDDSGLRNYFDQFTTDYRLATWLSDTFDAYSRTGLEAAKFFPSSYDATVAKMVSSQYKASIALPMPSELTGQDLRLEPHYYALEACEQADNIHPDWQLHCKIQKWLVGKA